MNRQYTKVYKDLMIYPGTSIALALKTPWHAKLVTETEHSLTGHSKSFATKKEALVYEQQLKQEITK